MKLNKFKKSLLLIVSIISIFGITSYNSQKYSSSVNINNSNIKDNNMLSMMLETSAGSGEYKETTASAWPTDGYEFNETLSKCEKGSSLSWDSTKNTVVMMRNNADKCYVYFNIKMPPLSDFIKSLYTNQGENNLYLHDSTLENGAGDNSYRYAGSNETTNNFVCFGYDSTDGTCPTDNLYRIIGVFDNQVKLIKYDYALSDLLGTDGDYGGPYSNYSKNYGTSLGDNSMSDIVAYYWNKSTNTNTWSESGLNKENLNINFLNNIGSKWANKISTHTWIVGGNTNAKLFAVTPNNSYQNEIISPMNTNAYEAKIGLMYLNDNSFASAPSNWTSDVQTLYGDNFTKTTWIYMGLSEWTITPYDYRNQYACEILYNAIPSADPVYSFNGTGSPRAIRPSFYLNSNVLYAGGSGTKASPFILS